MVSPYNLVTLLKAREASMSNQNKEGNLSGISKTFSGNKVPTLTKAIYPWSGIFRDACYALVGTFLLQYAMTAGVLSSDLDTYKAQMHIITIFMMIALVWDGINDPIMGFIVEKFHFKTGKFKPWIFIGAIGNTVTVTLMFLVGPLGVTGWGYVAAMLILYFFWDLFFTMNDIGYWSMLPSLTNDPKERASLTTHVTIATTIGAFMMNLLMFLLPTMLGAQTAYMYAGIVISLLFLISQSLIFFCCRERERDPKQEKISENTHLLDLFRMVIQNKQLLVVAITMLLYYFASGLLTGIGLNYYYLLYGYGTYKGGIMATVLSVVYVLGTLIAQVFYPLMAKKLKKMQIIEISAIVTIVAYLVFFFFAFPVFKDTPISYNANLPGNDAGVFEGLAFAFGGSHWIILLACFLFFAASGIFYLVLLVMFQDAIDYQEWKFGERKEAVAFAWRPLDAKLGSALQTGIRNLTFLVTGTQAIINNISTAESHNVIENGVTVYKGDYSSFNDEITAAYTWSDKRWQLTLFGIIIIGAIVISFTACFILLKKGYKIDEELEEKIVKELNERHEKDALTTKENTEQITSA